MSPLPSEPVRVRITSRNYLADIPARAVLAARRGISARSSSDIVVAGLGIALGLVCAFFPWYVFYNQDKFGIRAVRFSGTAEPSGIMDNLTYQPSLVGRRIAPEDVPLLELDQIATGTVPDQADTAAEEVPLSDQPFPGEAEPAPEYHLVHVANGRAMIEDKDGLFVVQIGSVLPDKSRVTSIDQRDGKWVVVTNRNAVLALGN